MRKTIRASITAALALTLVSITRGEETRNSAEVAGQAPPAAATQPATIPGVKNFAQISPGLYRGAQPTAEGFKELKKRGIKTIVNLRDFHSDRDELKGTELRYVHIKCDAWNVNEENVVKFLKVVQDKDNQPVFVHCQHGADRTGMMVASYRMVEQGWNVDDAVRELPAFGFHGVWKDIRAYLLKFDAAKVRAKVKEAKTVDVRVVK